MGSLCSVTALLTAIPVAVVVICAWIYFRQHNSTGEKRPPSDRQIVVLLVGLLIVAVFSIGAFLFMTIGSGGSWQYLCL
jgi:ABC-type amino acid transport system permease subunit